MGKRISPADTARLVAIGRRLREVIDASGLRQQDVAIRAGIGIRTLGWYLAGRDIPASRLIAIAEALEMEPSDLLRALTTDSGPVRDDS